jgi:hypothetical protein
MKPLTLALLLALPAGALAHDLWIEREEGVYTLMRSGPYDPATVQRAFCAEEGGLVRPAPFLQEQPVRIINDCAALLVEVSTGHWTQTPRGAFNQPQTWVPDALGSRFSEESVKRLDRWSEAMNIPTADAFEIVPKNDPFALGPGGTLWVEVTYQHVPMPHAAVYHNGVRLGVTGPGGGMRVTLRQPGRQQITATAEWPGDDNAFRVKRTTSLQFDLPAP